MEREVVLRLPLEDKHMERDPIRCKYLTMINVREIFEPIKPLTKMITHTTLFNQSLVSDLAFSFGS